MALNGANRYYRDGHLYGDRLSTGQRAARVAGDVLASAVLTAFVGITVGAVFGTGPVAVAAATFIATGASVALDYNGITAKLRDHGADLSQGAFDRAAAYAERLAELPGPWYIAPAAAVAAAVAGPVAMQAALVGGDSLPDPDVPPPNAVDYGDEAALPLEAGKPQTESVGEETLDATGGEPLARADSPAPAAEPPPTLPPLPDVIPPGAPGCDFWSYPGVPVFIDLPGGDPRHDEIAREFADLIDERLLDAPPSAAPAVALYQEGSRLLREGSLAEAVETLERAIHVARENLCDTTGTTDRE